MINSERFKPNARTHTSTQPELGSGIGRSSSFSTSGPPGSCFTTAWVSHSTIDALLRSPLPRRWVALRLQPGGCGHELHSAASTLRPASLAPRTRAAGATEVGERSQPGWAPRPALVALLVLTAVAYLWNLSASGYANSFYAAAVQAGTKSWKAFFFGSLDSSSFITVDKPPASLWVMALSGRIFGFSSWSMLVPQALEGVAAVALLYAAVKRWFGPAAGLRPARCSRSRRSRR